MGPSQGKKLPVRKNETPLFACKTYAPLLTKERVCFKQRFKASGPSGKDYIMPPIPPIPGIAGA